MYGGATSNYRTERRDFCAALPHRSPYFPQHRSETYAGMWEWPLPSCMQMIRVGPLLFFGGPTCIYGASKAPDLIRQPIGKHNHGMALICCGLSTSLGYTSKREECA
jgi:hypothetical protein